MAEVHFSAPQVYPLGRKIRHLGQLKQKSGKSRRWRDTADHGNDRVWIDPIRQVFSFEDLGFEETDERNFRVYFRDLELGQLNVSELRFRSVREPFREAVGKVTLLRKAHPSTIVQ